MTLFRFVLLGAVVLTVACGGSSSAASSDRLDPAVSMPAGFPSDFPVYPGARLTSAQSTQDGASFKYELQYETLDGIDKVGTFYTARMQQGDWVPQGAPGGDSERYAVFYSRRSSAAYSGFVVADVLRPGVTRIRVEYLHCATAAC